MNDLKVLHDAALPTILNEIMDSMAYRIVIPDSTQWISEEDFLKLIKAEKVYSSSDDCFFPSILTETVVDALRSIVAQDHFREEVFDVVAFFKNGSTIDLDTGNVLSGSVAIIASGKDGVHPGTSYISFINEI